MRYRADRENSSAQNNTTIATMGNNNGRSSASVSSDSMALYKCRTIIIIGGFSPNLCRIRGFDELHFFCF